MDIAYSILVIGCIVAVALVVGCVVGLRRGGAVRLWFLVLCGFVLVSLLLQWLSLLPGFSQTDSLLLRLQTACWLSSGAVFLWFAGALVARPFDRWTQALSFVALLNAAVGSFTSLLVDGYRMVPGGFVLVASKPNEALLTLVAILPAAVGLVWLERQRRTARALERRGLLVSAQAGAALAAGIVLIVDIALPWSGLITDVPRISAMALALGILAAYSAVRRHSLLEVTLASAAMPLFERLGDGVMLLDTAGRVRWANPAAQELLQPLAGALVGRSIDEVLGANVPLAEFSGRLFAVGTPDGPRHVSVTQWPNELLGVPLGRVLLVGDMTEHIQAQALARRSHDELEREVERRTAELAAAQKLDAASSLSRGVAHVLNNLLAVILGLSESVRDMVGGTPGLADDLDELLRAVARSKEIVRQIGPAAQQVGGRQLIGLRQVARQAWKEATGSLAPHISGRFECDCEGLVVADPTQLHQVLFNLLKNAREAMSGRSGVLGLRLTEVRLSPGTSLPDARLVPGNYGRVEISDEGCGIPKESLAIVFEPLYTTKPTGQGTGLGLFNARRIVEEHGGAITVTSEPGVGSVFSLWIPLVDQPTDDGPMVGLAFLGGTERILLVDDEPKVAAATVRLLEPLGYTVSVETEPREALSRIDRGEPFDVVILDQVMPGMTGTELAEALRAIGLRAPVLLLSGTTDATLEQAAARLGIRRVLRKPASRATLGRALREELDR